MKISNEQLRIMQESELLKAQQQVRPGGEFGEFFARQLEQENARSVVSQAGASLVSSQGAVRLLDIEQGGDAARGLVSVESAANRLDGMFADFERYAQQIAQAQGNNLREAYQTLQTVSDQVAGFKADFPGVGEQMPQLASLLNELDVLATTETFKFNRGDYL